MVVDIHKGSFFLPDMLAGIEKRMKGKPVLMKLYPSYIQPM